MKKEDSPATLTVEFLHTASMRLFAGFALVAAVAAAAILSGCSQCSQPNSSSANTAPAPAAAPAPPAVTELAITDTKVGTGGEAVEGKKAAILYRGMFLDGKVFDAREDKAKPLIFKLGAHELIAGLDVGVRGMRVGGQRKLVIPPALAYGTQGFGTTVPPDTPLVFEVELILVE